MKKKLLSVFLAFCMICSFLPATVLAATPADNEIKLELVKDSATFSGKDVLRVDFYAKSGTDTPNNQMVYLKFSADKLAPLYNVDGSDVSSNLTSFSINYGDSLTKNNYVTTGFGGGASEVMLYALVSGSNGYMCWKVTEKGTPSPFAGFTRTSSIFFGLKGDITFDKLPKDIIKLATVAEDETVTAQSNSISVTVNGSTTMMYGSKDASLDTLTVDLDKLFVAGAGVTFAEPAKPAYSGTIDAPKVKTNAGGKVELNAVTPSGGPGGETVQYGYSKTNDGKNITWQNSTTFNLTVGSTYYFYAKVVESATYKEKVSAASAAVPVADKALTNLEIVTAPTNKTYTHGDPFKADGMKVKATYNDSTFDADFKGYTVAYETSGKNYLCKDNTKVTLKAGDKSVEVTGLSVSAKELTVTDLTAKNREYKPGDTSVTLTGGTLNGVVSGETVTLDALPAGRITSADVGNGKDVTFTALNISGTDAGNYTLTQPTGIKVNITQATPEVGTVSYSGGTIYTSTDLSTISLSMDGSAVGPGTLALNAGQTLTPGTNEYDWTFKPNDATNYKTVTGKVSLTVEEDALVSIAASGTLSKTSYKYGENFNPAGLTVTATYASGKHRTLTSGEYTVTNGTMIMGQTEVTLTYQGKTCTVSGLTVSKADAKTLTDITVSQKYTVTTEQSKDIGRAGMPEDAGTLTYAVGSVTSTGGSASVTPSMTGSTVKFTITGGANGDVITLPVTIGSDNYADSIVNVVITLTNKDTPTVTVKDITVTYDGNAIPDSKITGTADVAGTWEWKSGMAVTNVVDSGDKTVVFKPTDSANYAEVEKTIKVTINRADPTGIPTYTAITTSGKKLSDAALASGSITPAGGTIAWDLGDTADVTANTAYGWTYNPTDTANYNPLKGSITPYVVSYSGGGSYTPTYAITVDKAANGTVTAAPGTAKTGDTVTLTATPDKGYELDTIKALDKDGKELKLTDQGNGKYTFTMPAGKVTVKAAFEDSNLVKFDDVSKGDYCYEAVKWAVKNGITSGIGNNRFGPNDPCTRGQIVTFLWRAAGSPEPKSMSSFSDVPADSYYAKAVAWAVEKGITSGTGDGKFSPEDPCSRAQSVTFLYRAAGSPAVIGRAEFSDVESDTYYAAAVAWAAKNGITSGTGGGQFGSDDECSRGHIVTFLFNAYGK